MQVKRLDRGGSERTFAIVLEKGEEVMSSLGAFAEEAQLVSARLSGIGAFSDAVLNFFDWETKEYLPIPVEEQAEVASLNGDIAIAPDGGLSLHIHLVLGRRDGSAVAGHLSKAHVRPTLEIMLIETPEHLQKVRDPETGLALIRPQID